MKQITVFNLYPILQKVAGCDLPYKMSWDLMQMMDEMKPISDFQLHKRRELIEKYKPEFIQETSEFKFEKIEDAKDFKEKQTELDELECEIKTPKIRIPIDFLEGGKIKANELIMLRNSELIDIYKPQVIELNLDENKEEESK